VIVQPRYRGPFLPTTLAVSMTAAASGSSGITVADDDDIDFGTGNFTIHWEGAVPDWSTADNARFWYKYQNTANRVLARTNSSGAMNLLVQVSSASIIDESSAASVETILSPNQNAKLTYVCTRETASTAGSVAFYINGALFDTQTIPAAATVSISNSGNGNISCSGLDGTGRLASTTRACYLYNRALSAAEVLSLCNNGVAAADVGGSQTAFYQQNTSAGADSWSGTTITVAGNVDAIGGRNDVLSATCTSTGVSDSPRIARSNVIPNAGKSARLSFSLYRPAANTKVVGYRVTDVAGLGLFSSTVNNIITTAADTWQTFVLEGVIAAGRGNGIRLYPVNSAGVREQVTGEVLYLDATLTNYAGCTLQLDPTGLSASGLTWTDSSGNGNNGTLPAAGATKVSIRK
jgi:hypothetical protein